MTFIRTGDKIRVIAGKEKGKEGIVVRVDCKNSRIVVKGLNMIEKYKKPSQTNQDGGVVEKEGSVHVSNVMLIDPESGKPARIGHEIVDSNKVRIAKVSDKAINKKQKGGS